MFSEDMIKKYARDSNKYEFESDLNKTAYQEFWEDLNKIKNDVHAKSTRNQSVGRKQSFYSHK